MAEYQYGFEKLYLAEKATTDRLRAQNAELRAALESLVSSFDAAPGVANTNAPAFVKARAAIAKARENQP